MVGTFVVDADHQSASLAVEKRADVLGHCTRQVRVEVSSAKFELTTARLRTDVLAAHVVLHSTPLPPAVVLPARQTETETNQRRFPTTIGYTIVIPVSEKYRGIKSDVLYAMPDVLRAAQSTTTIQNKKHYWHAVAGCRLVSYVAYAEC